MNISAEIMCFDEECLPIKLLDDLIRWEACGNKKHTSCPLRKRTVVKDFPKTLVCHDMKGGYLEDRFLNGTKAENGYYFVHWSMIDIFVYFSHNFITIPPCSWISAAHLNGAKVLGTFITEWDEGMKICEEVLKDENFVRVICLQLVNIAKFYQFDGWLINVENKLKIDQVALLETFLMFLTEQMHNILPGSLVIWYDSVIENGDLKWQNALTKNNRKFFDLCDGIFLNYNWTVDHLKESVKEAWPRISDVFVGVDVFGRGCLGGGGFSSNIAVTAARDFNLSVAIFAPGWVYECLEVEEFKENQFKFWNLLSELCATRVIEELPYYSSFCPGLGKRLFRNGQVISSEPWFNLSLQQLQPTFDCSASKSMTVNFEDAFNGGGCLQLTSSVSKDLNFINFLILSTNFEISSAFVVCYAIKALSGNVKVTLNFLMEFKRQTYTLKFLDNSLQDGDDFYIISDEVQEVSEVPNYSSKKFQNTEKGTPWIRRKYQVFSPLNETHFVKEVSIEASWEKASEANISLLLGELKITPASSDVAFFHEDLKITVEGDCATVECTLLWTASIEIHSFDLFFRVNNKREYICSTSQLFYSFKGKISNLYAKKLEFILIPKCETKVYPVVLRIPLDILSK